MRSQFESLTAPLIQRTVDPSKKALNDAGVKASEINGVILVGERTRTPRVVETVKTIFGGESSNPDEAVVIGASIQGALWISPENGISVWARGWHIAQAFISSLDGCDEDI